jgi:hypothetical protein
VTSVTPPGSPAGANSPITWGQFGAVFAIVFSIVAPLTSALYIGVREGQKETNDRIKSLEETIRNAIPVLANAPKLEKTINQAHDDVIVLQESIKHLETIPAQMQSMQIQLNNIQQQVHMIPGVKP